MYEAFFGLSARPFADRPDPDFFIESEPHVAALRALADGIEALHPLFVVTGDAGCGKSLLARVMIGVLGASTTVGLINNAHTSVRDLTRWALLSFGQQTLARTDSELQEALALYLVAEYGAGRRCLLLVDEAQNLTTEALAGLHRYLDLNRDGDCLLQVVLVGGSRLLQRVSDPSLAHWADRLPQICLVGPLAGGDVPRYVRARLAAGGAGHSIFTDRALVAIATASRGVPRLVNAICDMALLQAFALGRHMVDRDVIADIVTQGRASGIGSLAMLTSLEPAAEGGNVPALEPSEEASQQERISETANVAASGLQAASNPEAPLAAAAPPTVEEIQPAAVEPEFFPIEPPDFFPADFLPLSPAPTTAPSLPGQDEAPATAAPPAVSEIVPAVRAAGWPSIARNSRLVRVAQKRSPRAHSAAAGQSLRRRFLPRD
jgi:type II secretory pathway predicted ATPase ExeA